MTRLQINNSYNVNLMIIDYLTKKKYYISYITNQNNTIAKAITYLL